VPVLCAFDGVGIGVGPERRACLLWYGEDAREDVCSGEEASTANVAFFGSGVVVSTSSALHFPLAVSECPGDETGV
jgi:hypothetical protein